MAGMGFIDWIKSIGGKREDETVEREEFGGADAGAAEEKHLAETGYGTPAGLAGGEAADVADADLEEFEPPRDPAP
jgi:hypothetical protein